MTSLREIVDRELIAALVGRNLGLCPVTGTSFDVRNAVVFRDADGDPVMVVSPKGYRELVQEQASAPSASRLAKLKLGGYQVDESTVPA